MLGQLLFLPLLSLPLVSMIACTSAAPCSTLCFPLPNQHTSRQKGERGPIDGLASTIYERRKRQVRRVGQPPATAARDPSGLPAAVHPCWRPSVSQGVRCSFHLAPDLRCGAEPPPACFRNEGGAGVPCTAEQRPCRVQPCQPRETRETGSTTAVLTLERKCSVVVVVWCGVVWCGVGCVWGGVWRERGVGGRRGREEGRGRGKRRRKRWEGEGSGGLVVVCVGGWGWRGGEIAAKMHQVMVAEHLGVRLPRPRHLASTSGWTEAEKCRRTLRKPCSDELTELCR